MNDVAGDIFDLIATTFGCRRSLVTRASEAEDIDGWDSLSHSVLLLAIERHFGIRLDYDAVWSMENVGELIDSVSATLRSTTTARA